MRATKSVTQFYEGSELRDLLDQCLTMTYNGIAYGRENDIDSRNGMKEFYRSLNGVPLPSCYKVAVRTRACAILKGRRKTANRGKLVSHPKPLRPMICIISGFFITARGRFFIPLRRDKYFDLQLNHHVLARLAGKKARSVTIGPGSLSFCFSEEVESIPAESVFGVDSNERNMTFGTEDVVTQINLSEGLGSSGRPGR